MVNSNAVEGGALEDEKPLLPPLSYEAVDDGRFSEGISERISERRPLQVDGDAAPVFVLVLELGLETNTLPSKGM